jgi:hypothetical protein
MPKDDNSLYDVFFSDPMEGDVPRYISEMDLTVAESTEVLEAISIADDKTTELATRDEDITVMRESIDQVHFDKLTTIIDAALDAMLQRVTKGDPVMDFAGNTHYKPIKAATLNLTLKILMERQDIARARIKLAKGHTDDRMSELLAALQGSSRDIIDIDSELVQNGTTDKE